MTTKKWVMPVTAASIYNNSAATIDADWRAINIDLCDGLEETGWIQESDAGQVDLTTALAPMRGSYAGYKIYQLIDGHESIMPIYLKIEFGIDQMAVHSSAYRLERGIVNRYSFSFDKTFPANAASTYVVSAPFLAGYASNAITTNWALGTNLICSVPSLGFYGYVYGKGHMVPTSPSFTYLTPTLASFFLQRNLNSNGQVIAGVSIYTNRNGVWYSGNNNDYPSTLSVSTRNMSECQYISPGYSSPKFTTTQVAPMFVTSMPGAVPSLQVLPVYSVTPEIKQLPSLLVYNMTQMEELAPFEVETLDGVVRTYLPLGLMNVYAGEMRGYAMLWQ